VNPQEEKALVLAGVAALLFLGWLWLTAALSAATFGSGWTPTPASELPLVGARLLSHLGDPGSAWPTGYERSLPGPVPFYVVGTLLGACTGALAISVLRAARRLGLALPDDGSSEVPTARWARAADLRELRVSGPQRARVMLGRFGNRLVAAQERRSVLVFGPTESHKTSGLLTPAVLEWDGPVLVTSVKSDLVRDTLAAREDRGDVFVFDPAHVTTRMPRAQINPILSAGTWRGAMKVADWLSSAARTSSGAGLDDANFWFLTAEKLLQPLLFAAASSGRSMATVVRWLDEGPAANEKEVLNLLEETGVPEARRAFLATQNREEKQRSSVYTTAETMVKVFADPYVAEETARADYTPADLLDGRSNTLYLCGTLKEQERLGVLFSMVTQELIDVAYETATATGKPISPPLLIVNDEAANGAPLPNLDEVASTAAAHGVQLLSACQDLAQLKAVYGIRAETIANNHVAKIFCRGIADPSTAEYASRIAGRGAFQHRSRTAAEDGEAVTEGDAYWDLVSGSVLREQDLSTAVLIYGSLPPTRIRLRPWFEDGELRRLKERSPSRSSRRGVKG
jgi:type IV secretion system protein VirD4